MSHGCGPILAIVLRAAAMCGVTVTSAAWAEAECSPTRKRPAEGICAAGLSNKTASEAGFAALAPVASLATGQPTEASSQRQQPAKGLEAVESERAPGKLMTQDELLADLFKRYRSLKEQLQAHREQREATMARLSEATRELSKIMADYKSNESQVDQVLQNAKAVRSKCMRVLSMPAPRRPQLQGFPPRPNPNYYDSAYSYDQALSEWRGVCALIEQNNARLIQQYEVNVRQYQELCRQAKVNLEAADDKIAECERALQALLEARQEAERPLKTERQRLTEGMRNAEAEAHKLVQNLKATTESIRAVPARTRFQRGVIEWQGGFCTLAEIEKMHTALVREIEASRGSGVEGFGPEAERFHRASPHPKQGQADTLKALIEQARKAKAGQASGGNEVEVRASDTDEPKQR